jgi:hypothetical protein
VKKYSVKRLLEIAGKLKERKVAQEPDLWAFWKYAVYPFFLSGIVLEQDEKGRVKVKGYGGWFKPFYLARGKHGEDIHKLGKRLRAAYKIHRECSRNAAGNVGAELLRDAGLPIATLGLELTGWQGEAYQKLFKKQLKQEKR